MYLVYSLEEPPDLSLPSIFLAGPTPQQHSKIKSWRPRAIEIFKKLGFDDGIIFVPENRQRSDKINHEKQPKWEHRMLHKASCVLFWIPRDLKKLPGFTTNVEFGLLARSGKINLGAPKNADKISYLRFVAREFSIPQHWNLEETIKTAIQLAYYSRSLHNEALANKTYLYCPFCASRLQEKTEENRQRKYCPECRWTYYPTPHIATAAVITRTRSDGELQVLMVKRKRDPFKETWMFPAGFLEFGEHPEEDTLPREILEEVGLTIVKSRLIKIIKSSSDYRSPNHLVFFYHVQVTGEIASNDPDENSTIEWKSLRENIAIGFPHHRTVFDLIRLNPDEYFK